MKMPPLLPPPPPHPEKERKKGKRNSLLEPNLSLHNMNQCFSFGQVSWDPNATEMRRICLGYAVSFKPAHVLLSEVVYKWEHLCYLWNTLAKNNPACRIRLFLHLPAQHRHTCNLASGLEPAAMGSPIRQWGQSSDLAGCRLTHSSAQARQRLER